RTADTSSTVMAPESLKTPAMPHMVERPTSLRSTAREDGTASEQVPGEPFVEPSVKQVGHVSATFHAAQSDPSWRLTTYATDRCGKFRRTRSILHGKTIPSRSFLPAVVHLAPAFQINEILWTSDLRPRAATLVLREERQMPASSAPGLRILERRS